MKKSILKILKYIGVIILVLSLTVILFINFHPVFGGAPSDDSMKKIKSSKNYDGEKFKNLVKTKIYTGEKSGSSKSGLNFLKEIIYPLEGKNPNSPLPSNNFKVSDLVNNSFVWFGHSTILMKLDKLIVLTDPVFYDAAPVPGIIKPFSVSTPITIKDLPKKIDIVIISHDHYDHLDYYAIQELDKRVERFIVPLGIKGHLTKWGINESKIDEKDWYESVKYKSLIFTCTPARHFSGRGTNDKFATLWCSWVVKSSKLKAFFNGDSGYFDEFKEIGNKYGPFDIAFMENGAYDDAWAEIHMLPEESVQANIDLQSKLMFPIHWGKFDLANHKWDEPIIRTDKETELKNVTIATPLIGQVFTLDNVPHTKWWEMVRASQNK